LCFHGDKLGGETWFFLCRRFFSSISKKGWKINFRIEEQDFETLETFQFHSGLSAKLCLHFVLRVYSTNPTLIHDPFIPSLHPFEPAPTEKFSPKIELTIFRVGVGSHCFVCVGNLNSGGYWTGILGGEFICLVSREKLSFGVEIKSESR
jgi:hypothetical protein